MYERIKGEVKKGRQIGNQIGFPTANIALKKWLIPDGTYKINVLYNNKIYKWAWVYRESLEVFESHIFDFHADIYGKEIEVIILEKIRNNKLFSNTTELKHQIEKDIKKIIKQDDYVLTFGTFDVIHPGHKHFLSQAKQYGDKLVTVVATDENVKKFKWKLPLHNKIERFEDVKSLWIADIVCMWWWDRPLIRIELYNPKVVCLWYDQFWFIEKLETYIKEKNVRIQIIRIAPYKPDIYKSSIIKGGIL